MQKRYLPRTVQPDLLRNWDLIDAEMSSGLPLTVAMIGLYMVSDRDGRFDWNPLQLRNNIFPSRNKLNIASILAELHMLGLVQRYEYSDDTGSTATYGQVSSWTDIQNINRGERQSIIPGINNASCVIIDAKQSILDSQSTLRQPRTFESAVKAPAKEVKPVSVKKKREVIVKPAVEVAMQNENSVSLFGLDLFSENTQLAEENNVAAPKFKMDRGTCYRVDVNGLDVLATGVEDNSMAMDIEFTLIGGNTVTISSDKFNQYQALYPGVDITQRVKQSAQWLIDNQSRRKTMSGMPSFINQWLITSQNSGQGTRSGLHSRKPSQTDRVSHAVDRMREHVGMS